MIATARDQIYDLNGKTLTQINNKLVLEFTSPVYPSPYTASSWLIVKDTSIGANGRALIGMNTSKHIPPVPAVYSQTPSIIVLEFSSISGSGPSFYDITPYTTPGNPPSNGSDVFVGANITL